MERIQAVIRVRPLSAEERSGGVKEAWCKVGERGLIQHLSAGGLEVSAQAMFFDGVFGPEESNGALFSYVHPTIAKILNGTSVCIIAYGQTSSGKTHTMKGTIETPRERRQRADPKKQKISYDPGIIPRSLEEIFKIASAADGTFEFTISFVEIYNENVFDLLGDPTESLQVRELPTGETYVKDAQEISVTTVDEAINVFLTGESSRKVGATKMNRESSRSHAVLKLKTVHRQGHQTLRSSATFVDLAGSERSRQTKAQGAQLKEGGHINKSLLALTSVISKLSLGQTHVPYRDAKLTRILQPSLSGNSFTTIVCTVSSAPQWLEETLSTLNLANRAKNITVKPLVNSTAGSREKTSKTRVLKLIKSTGEVLSEIKDAHRLVAESKTLLRQASTDLEEIFLSLKQAPQNSSSELGKILSELKTTKATHLSKLSELALSVKHLLKQEKYFSEIIKPPPDISTLLQHLVEGDKLIQQQRSQIKTLLSRPPEPSATAHPRAPIPIDTQTLTMAVELDRLKKEYQREKRMLQLRIAQLESKN
ncbi:kinesin family member 3/17 [Nematocida displodere]|uniref:Kinesin family member 3/17 n=1 Tax=Nematocida displodere TaxID=1805483 RepID=A0A177EBV9_9MICR|nr:kinesin family member 3/17 [Nematocida displodere]